VIIGPADTPFEDGTFKLVMQFDENYPNKPPHVKFISRMVCPHSLFPKSSAPLRGLNYDAYWVVCVYG